MRFEEFYNRQEHGVLSAAMPSGALLFYSWVSHAYEIRHIPEGMRSTRLLRSIPRAEILRWREPRLTLNHAARHALKVAGLPAAVRQATSG